jgi:hypothetical protein
MLPRTRWSCFFITPKTLLRRHRAQTDEAVPVAAGEGEAEARAECAARGSMPEAGA